MLYALDGFIKKQGERQSKTLHSRASASTTSKTPDRPASNRHQGSSIDDFLREEGVSEAFQARAIKEVIAWQLEQAMKEQNLSKRRLAALMHTSRTQIDRMLDPKDGNVTIETLQRAAALLGRKVQVELV
jgi:antitoxin HicB